MANRLMGKWVVAGCVLTLSLGSLLTARPSAQEDANARGIWPEVFMKKRPPSKKGAAARTPPRPTPQPTAAVAEDAMVGVTIWRLRPENAGDDKGAVRILRPKKDSKQLVKYILERIEEGKPIPAGENVRLGIEVPRSGYLYVIDREEYAENKLGDPILIFPSTLSLNNAVAAGRLVMIPTDPEVYFESDPQPDQRGELLTLLVTPEPLNLKVGPETTTPLPKEQFALWEKRWSVRTERIKVDGAADQLYLEAEKAAAEKPKQMLTQDDPPPQVIYRVAAKPGDPLFVSVRLQYR